VVLRNRLCRKGNHEDSGNWPVTGVVWHDYLIAQSGRPFW
jgi:hypothetical protein